MNEIKNVKIFTNQKEIGKPSKDTFIEAEIIGTNLNKDLETQLEPAEYQYTEETAGTLIPSLPPSTHFPRFFSAAHKHSNRKIKSEKEIKGKLSNFLIKKDCKREFI